MKKNFLAMMSLLFMTLAVFTITSCGDDDKKGGTPGSDSYPHQLVGSWSGYGKYVTFKADGTGTEGDDYITWYVNTKNELVIREGDDTKIFRYSVEGNTLTLDRLYDDDRDHYVLQRTNSGGGGKIDQALLGIWAGSKQYDNDTYIFTFSQNGEGNKKEIDTQDQELDNDYFTWSINSNGQLEIRERGDNEIKIYTYSVNGQNLTLTRNNDNYSLSRRLK